MKDFLNNFADQLDETDSSLITENTIFRDLEEWSSLTALSVIAMADEEYDVELKGDDMRNAQSIRDLYNIIISKSK